MAMDSACFLSLEQMEKIGLQSRREFLRDRAQAWIKMTKDGDFDRYYSFELDELLRVRGTGRTTEMLVEALYVLWGGSPVLIMAHRGSYARELRGRLSDWCAKLGVATDLVLSRSPRIVPRDMRTFYDHYKGLGGQGWEKRQ